MIVMAAVIRTAAMGTAGAVMRAAVMRAAVMRTAVMGACCHIFYGAKCTFPFLNFQILMSGKRLFSVLFYCTLIL